MASAARWLNTTEHGELAGEQGEARAEADGAEAAEALAVEREVNRLSIERSLSFERKKKEREQQPPPPSQPPQPPPPASATGAPAHEYSDRGSLRASLRASAACASSRSNDSWRSYDSEYYSYDSRRIEAEGGAL